jgi:tetratricopeptide (TPR) repeat protein
VKLGLLPVAVLGLVAVGGAVAMQTAGRERAYRNLLNRGDASLRDGDTFGAIEAYSGAVALHPESMLAHLRRGESYRQRGELEAAARDFRTATGLDPAAPRPLEALADVYYERQRYARAIETYERRLRLDNRAPRISYKLALTRYRSGDVTGAMTTLTETLRLDSRLPDAHYLLGLCLRDEGQAAEAVEAFERAVTLAPGMIPAREELALLYDQLGRYPNQLEQLQVLAALDSAHVQRQIAVGIAHARAGHPDAAAVTLANALERTPNEPLVYQELGRLWLDVAVAKGDPAALAKALEALEHVGAGPNASSEALTLYGRALAMNNELDSAQRLLEQATRRYPIDASSFVALADLAESQHQLAVARTALLDYHALVGDGAEYPARAARIAALSQAMNDLPAATTWLQRATTAEPSNLKHLIALGDVQLRSGNTLAAQVTVARGLDREPENAELLALAQRIQRSTASAAH